MDGVCHCLDLVWLTYDSSVTVHFNNELINVQLMHADIGSSWPFRICPSGWYKVTGLRSSVISGLTILHYGVGLIQLVEHSGMLGTSIGKDGLLLSRYHFGGLIRNNWYFSCVNNDQRSNNFESSPPSFSILSVSAYFTCIFAAPCYSDNVQ